MQVSKLQCLIVQPIFVEEILVGTTSQLVWYVRIV